MKKIRAFIKKHFSLLVVIAIMIIPTIYTVLFLGSMWDPYGNVSTLPVAVVNEDNAVEYNGSELAVGDKLCDGLKENASLQFNFVDEDVAMDGIKNGTFYMVIVIPSDFSYNATTLSSGDTEKMVLDYYTSPGTNYIATKISESAMNTIKTSITQTVIKTYADTIFSSINTAGAGFQEAADGSGKIYGGLTQVSDGLLTLSDGTDQLKDGTFTLKDGVNQYTNGVSQLKDGTNKLVANNDTINNGVASAIDGEAQLKDGASQLLDGVQEISDTIGDSLDPETQEQLKTLEAGLIELNDGIQTLNTSINGNPQITELVTQLNSSIESLNHFINSDFYQQIKSHNIVSNASSYEKLCEALNSNPLFSRLPSTVKTSILNSLKTIYDDMDESGLDYSALEDLNLEGLVKTLNTTVKTLNTLLDGVQQLSDGGNAALPVASETLKTLSGGMLSVKDALDGTGVYAGKTGVIAGMKQLNGGIGTLQSGTKTLQAGLITYTNGVEQVNTGVETLVSNNKKLNEGVQALYDGALQLQGGDKQLDDGVSQLLLGTNTLQTSLQGGADQVSANVLDDNAAEMMSQPVTTEKTEVSKMDSNGTAMAAYMMCAGLWIGCLAFCLMFNPFQTTLKNKKGRKTFITLGTISAFVAVVQAVVMVSMLILINGMAPAHILPTFLMAILISLAFMSIVYCLNTLLGPIGSFVLLVLLVLQLSCAAGTYPIETSPAFYKALHPFMPFTYGVYSFRSTLSTGLNLEKPIIIFIAIIIVFNFLTGLTFVVRAYNQIRKEERKVNKKFRKEVGYYNAES